MKNLLIIALLLCSTQLFAQTVQPHKVTTTDGKTYSGEIESYLGKKVIVKETTDKVITNKIPVDLIMEIEGFLKNSRKNAIQRGNPSIVFTDPALENQLNANEQSPYVYMGPNNATSEVIRTASTLRLTGAVVGFGALALNYGGVFDDMDPDSRKRVMTVACASAAVCFLVGEITLIGATKKAKNDAITLTGAQSGLGLAVNF